VHPTMIIWQGYQLSKHLRQPEFSGAFHFYKVFYICGHLRDCVSGL
jgi:hypothetical protein